MVHGATIFRSGRIIRSHYASVHGLPGVKAMLSHGCQRRHPLTYIVIGSHSTYRLVQRFTKWKPYLHLTEALPLLPPLQSTKGPMDKQPHTLAPSSLFLQLEAMLWSLPPALTLALPQKILQPTSKWSFENQSAHVSIQLKSTSLQMKCQVFAIQCIRA